jgi:hypothetical protein
METLAEDACKLKIAAGCLVFLSILLFAMSGCTRRPMPENRLNIDVLDLLIKLDMLPGEWRIETGPTKYSSYPLYQNDLGGSSIKFQYKDSSIDHFVVRFNSIEDANKNYASHEIFHDTGGLYPTKWVEIQDLKYQSKVATQYLIICMDVGGPIIQDVNAITCGIESQYQNYLSMVIYNTPDIDGYQEELEAIFEIMDKHISSVMKDSVLNNQIIATPITPSSTLPAEEQLPEKIGEVLTLTPSIDLPIISTGTPVPQSSLLPIRVIEQHCAVEKELPASDFISEGVIFLEKYQSVIGGIANLMMLRSKEKETFLNIPEVYGLAGISNDKRWLAYWDSENLNIISSKGNVQIAHHFNHQWFGSYGWLDDRRIVFAHAKRKPVGVDIFDPFENKIQTVEPGFKDIYDYDFESSGWRVWKLVVDPTLTRAAYMRDAGGPEFVIWDLARDKEIWHLKRASIGLNDPPEWSSDGKRLEVIVANEPEEKFERFHLYTIDQNGLPTEWVDVPTAITFGQSGAQWSPDGRYIAFHGESLYVLDMEKQKLIDYCLPPNPNYQGYGEIIWSPNSKQLIYQRYEMPGLIVDLDQDITVPLSDDPLIEAVGWLEEAP